MSKFYRENGTVLFNMFGMDAEVSADELKANSTDAAGEKHVPQVTKNGKEIIVEVGSVAHPMLEAHYIMGVYVETTNGGQLQRFKPGDEPRAVFTLKDGEEFVAAYEYCNLHGLWKTEN